MRRLWRGVPLVHAVLLGSACRVSDSHVPTPVESVVVTPQALEVVAGTAGALVAEVTDGAGNVLRDRRVVWASANPGIATVSDNGVVTGVSVGNVQIAATSEGKSAIASVTVVRVPVSRVTIIPSSVSVGEGKSRTLTAQLTDAAGNMLTNRTVTWSSANTGIATVDQFGVVRGVRRGTVVITATSEGKFGTATVTVN
jgi:uncharacterized protein YjdB